MVLVYWRTNLIESVALMIKSVCGSRVTAPSPRSIFPASILHWPLSPSLLTLFGSAPLAPLGLGDEGELGSGVRSSWSQLLQSGAVSPLRLISHFIILPSQLSSFPLHSSVIFSISSVSEAPSHQKV